MRVVVAPSSCCLATNATDVWLLTRVNLQVVGQVVASGESLMTMLALVVPGSIVFSHMPLPVALHSELETTLVTDKRLDATMGAHVLLQQGLPQVSLLALSAFEGSLALVLVLPHVIDQITLGNELLFADVA